MKTLCAILGCLPLLGACGGGESGEAAVPTVTATALIFAAESDYGPGDRPGALASHSAIRADEPAAPVSDPAAMPVDHAARTRPGLYLRRADAERWEKRLRGDVVWLDAGCCAGEDADMAVLGAYGMQAAKNLGNDAPFFVTGGDLRLAARLVDRLAATGSRRAFLVTP